MTYIIKPFRISTLDFNKIPKNALTQYAYRTRPVVQNAKKTDKAHKNHPIFNNQRKVIPHKDKPAIIALSYVAPAQNAPHSEPYHLKYRNYVNKAALNEYFDNMPTPQEDWLADVVAELNHQDTIRIAETATAQEELRQFVESVRNPQPDFKPVAKNDKPYICVVIIDLGAVVRDIMKNISDQKVADETRMAINANTLHKFEQQMRRQNQARGMKKMHDMNKLRHR